jgi:hypothetical protein
MSQHPGPFVPTSGRRPIRATLERLCIAIGDADAAIRDLLAAIPDEPPQAQPQRPGYGRLTTSLPIDPAKLGALKMLAHRKRVRVNDLILDAIDDYLVLHGGRAE